MTISTSANTVTLSGNGVTTVFDYSFVAGNASYISVIYTDASGNQTTLLQSQYTLAINAPAPGQIWGIGGTVTYPLTGSPIAAQTTLTITRTVPEEQLVSISNQGDFYPAAVEQAMDLLEMQIQQVSVAPSRSIQAPLVDLDPQMILPAAAQRAGQFVAFDSNGNVIVAQSTGGGTVVSGAMQPVVEAPTLLLARAAMGLAIGTNVEAWSQLLDDIAGITWAQGDILYYNGSHLVALTPGINGQFLETQGASANPVWGTPPPTVLRSYLAGMVLSNDATTPNAVLDIAPGQATDSTNAVYINLGAFKKSTGGTWVAGTGNNGMGTGLTIASSTWYHVFAIINNGAADVYFDTSVAAANAPAGTTAFRRIGSFKTDSSAHILAFIQSYDLFFWKAVPALDVNGTSLTGSTPATFSLGSVPPGLIVEAILHVNINNNTNPGQVYVYQPTVSDQVSNAAGGPLASFNNSNAGAAVTGEGGQLRVLTNASAQIRANTSVTGTLYTVGIGWRDFLGRGA